jgi:hypothetical protein
MLRAKTLERGMSTVQASFLGTYVHGFGWSPLPINIHPNKHIFISILIFVNTILIALTICFMILMKLYPTDKYNFGYK